MKPNRSRSGPVMRPVRVVAPMSVKRGQLEADRARRRTLPDHDVELEVFHRRIEHLFDRARQAVDLVDEQHVAVVEVGEDGGEVAGAFERGPARDAQADVHLGGHDPRERGLAEAGRTGEQEVVDRLARARAPPPAGCRGAPSGAVGRRTRRAGAAGAWSPPPPRPDRPTARSNSSLIGELPLTARDRQQLERLAEEVLDRALLRDLGEHVAHLVGSVAEPGQRGTHLGARRGPAAGFGEVELGHLEPGLQLDQRAAARCACPLPAPA